MNYQLKELLEAFPELRKRPADEIFRMAERMQEQEQDDMRRFCDENGDPYRDFEGGRW